MLDDLDEKGRALTVELAVKLSELFFEEKKEIDEDLYCACAMQSLCMSLASFTCLNEKLYNYALVSLSFWHKNGKKRESDLRTDE